MSSRFWISSILLISLYSGLPAQASECFPTESRGMVHGISAAVGKLGALSADIIMGQVCAFCAVQLPAWCSLRGSDMINSMLTWSPFS